MPPPPPPVPEQIGRYTILRRLGAGGMAEVFLAKSTGAEGIEKVLVVKRVLPTFARSAKFIAMFLEEAKIATRLNHPNIVQVYAFEQVKDEFLLAMEFVDGLDLGRLVSAARRRGERIPFGLAALVTLDVAKGLDYAHRRRDERGEAMEIVHRDVSPQNVLLSYDGVVKVADFGIAKARLVSEETGVIKGKFSYMSPEQARGERVDRRSDVYSLGVLLGELLMNRPMYPGQHGLDVLESVRRGQITAPERVDPTIPKELSDVVRRATAFDRDDRFQSARSLGAALAQYLHDQDTVVDAEALERFIGETVPRENTSPDATSSSRRGEITAATVASAVANADRELRERRHVVVIAGRVRGDVGRSDGAAAVEMAVGDEAARVLADIAYKSDAVLSWPDGAGRSRFRFILGLRRASVHDPLRAMTLALDVVDALVGIAVDTEEPVTASVGVSRGIVSTVRDSAGRLLRYEPVGGVIEVAGRLADEGRGGEVLVAGEVYRLARRVFAFDAEGGREVEVGTDGDASKRRGLRAYRLRGARTREERSADARRAPGATRLVGRDEELRAIGESYLEAVTERRAVYLAITGDLGVGKTSLVAAAIDQLEPPPRVLHAECAFGTSDVPFATIAELARESLGIPDNLPQTEVRARLADRTAELVPDPDARRILLAGFEPLLCPEESATVDRDAAERPRAIAKAARLMLGIAAAQKPLVVWLDALQWADGPSLALIAALISGADEVPLLAVLSTRPDPDAEHVLGELPHVEVEELSDPDRRALIRARFEGASVPADVENAIVERAGGNPFFLIELVEALLERGVVALHGEGSERRVVRKPGVPIALPTTLEGVVAARLDELPEEERHAVRWLAASGPGLTAEQLSAIAGSDLSAPLAALEHKGVLARQHDREYAFPSAVVRHVAYDTTDEADRVVMHERIGAWLSRQAAPPPARVARHLERAGDTGGAAEAYMHAAMRARAVYSNREALRFFARALALLPRQAAARFFAHEAREQILRGMGRPEEQALELESMRVYAEALGNPAMRATTYARLARLALDQSRVEGVDEHLAKALAAAREARDRGAEVEALRLSAQLAREVGEPARALEACEQALERCGLDRSLLAARGSVLVQKAEILRRAGRLPESLEANAEAVVLFRRLGIKRNESAALNSLGIALVSIGEWEDAAILIRASIGLDREIGDRMHLGRKLSNVGQLNAELGAVEAALEFLERADTVLDALQDDAGRTDALCALAELKLEMLSDVDGAAECLDRARRLAERTGDRYDLARERIVRTMLELAMGRLEQAEGAAREAVHIAASGGVVMYQLLAQALLADTLARRGLADEARHIAEDVRELVRVRGSVERAERVHLVLARAYRALGDERDARETFAEAYREVESRLERIRRPELRERYLATPTVEAIRNGA